MGVVVGVQEIMSDAENIFSGIRGEAVPTEADKQCQSYSSVLYGSTFSFLV